MKFARTINGIISIIKNAAGQIRTNVADEKEMKRFTNFDSSKIQFQSIYNPNPSRKLT